MNTYLTNIPTVYPAIVLAAFAAVVVSRTSAAEACCWRARIANFNFMRDRFRVTVTCPEVNIPAHK